jgi:hypothetical protein
MMSFSTPYSSRGKKMKQLLRRSVLSLTLATLAACSGGGEKTQQSDAQSQSTNTGGQAMPGMGGMQGMEGGMMAEMQSHMQAMMGASGDSLMKVLPEHRQMTANMLAQMNQQMRGMQGGPEWDEAVRAVRQDLVRMPEMSAEELKAYLPQHQEHVQKLMEMHRSMTGNMNRP